MNTTATWCLCLPAVPLERITVIVRSSVAILAAHHCQPPPSLLPPSSPLFSSCLLSRSPLSFSLSFPLFFSLAPSPLPPLLSFAPPCSPLPAFLSLPPPSPVFFLPSPLVSPPPLSVLPAGSRGKFFLHEHPATASSWDLSTNNKRLG